MMIPEEYVKYMVDTYGVRSCYEDADEVAREDLWFECPECGEPILFADYPAVFVDNQPQCPVCEEEI